MSEPTILPVLPGSISAEDKAALSAAGVVVIEHERPGSLRLLKPSFQLSRDDMFFAAITALNHGKGFAEQEQRAAFTKLVCELVTKKRG